MRLLQIPWMIASVLSLTGSCSKEEKPKPPGNAFLLFDVTEDKVVDGTDMTVKRVRAWKAAPNSNTPGIVNLVDTFTLEMWFVLSGEEKMRYSVQTNLIGDESFNLYNENTTPGLKSYRLESSRITAEEPFTYTITAENGLVAEEFPVAADWEEVTTAVGVTTYTTQLIKAHDVKDSPWTSIRSRTIVDGLIAVRQRYEENTSLGVKGKLGCVVKTPNEQGAMLPKTYVFGDVELGSVFQDKTGQGISGTPTGLGDDDALWIGWNEYWLLTGASLNDRKLRFIRVRTAPFFNARELPGVDISDVKPKVSGMESLVRSCNASAARTNGFFSMMSLSGSPLAPNLILGTQNSFCQSLVTSVAATPDAMRLDTYFPCVFSGLLATAAGTWNGAAHSGPVASAGSSLVHIEQTEIKEIQF